MFLRARGQATLLPFEVRYIYFNGRVTYNEQRVKNPFDLKENVFHNFPAVLGNTAFSEENTWQTSERDAPHAFRKG